VGPTGLLLPLVELALPLVDVLALPPPPKEKDDDDC
jgi:hypothetical protein